MGWFRKTKTTTVAPPVPPEEMWVICPSCKAHVFKEEWHSGLKVCPKCNFHDRLTCRERIDILLDPKSFSEIAKDVGAGDPLQFVDAKGSYKDKAEEARQSTGLKEAVLTGVGKIGGGRVVLAVMDFRFLGGSLGGGTGEKILRATTYAMKHRLPLIIISASGGARMHEGIVALMQMAKTCAGIARLDAVHVPYISIMTHPTTGGVSASFAMVGDLNIAEPGALIGFAGRRVIEQTIKQKLPDDFQTAEYLLQHGFVDSIVPRSKMRDFLISVLRYWKNR